MAIDLSGMFKNLGAATSALGESVRGPALPEDPNQRNAMQRAGVTNPLLQRFGMGLGGAMGMDMRSQAAVGSEAFGKALDQPWQQQLAVSQKLIQMGMTDQGTALFEMAQQGKAAEEAKLKDQKTREALSQRAQELGLDSTAQLIRNGGDLKEAQKQILKEEERSVLGKAGRKGKETWAKQRGLTSLAEKASKGEYDSMSFDDFTKMDDLEKAKLEAWQDTSGISRAYRVNEDGKVWDETSDKWVNPSLLGLTPAPQLTRDVTPTGSLNKILTEKRGDVIMGNLDLASNAQEALAINDELLGKIDQGILTGSFANVQRATYGVLAKAGLLGEDQLTKLENTEAYQATVGQAVAKAITAFGAGTGLSDKDREFAERMAGGNIAVTEDALREILRIRDKQSKRAINNYLNDLEGLYKDGVLNEMNYKAYTRGYKRYDVISAEEENRLNKERQSGVGDESKSQPKTMTVGKFKVTVQ